MEKSLINASLSTENLTFRRGGSPAIFEVTVNNDSEQFANFQLEISAPGENRNSEYSWYKLSPEVAAAQPHGSSTQFQVSIIDTPIPGFVGIVNLTVNIFSPQLRQKRRLLLRLKIEADSDITVLKVELPVQNSQVLPRNTVDIPVRVKNLGQQAVNVTLYFLDIDPLWLIGGSERRLLLDPGGETEVIYQCQPPSVVLCPSRNYPFTVKAMGHNSLEGKGEANLEVLPIGFVKFTVTPTKQKIPTLGRWWIDWKSNIATFELGFKNTSNLRQQVNVLLQGRDWRKCTFGINPQDADINIGSNTDILLNVKTKRPIIGVGKNLLLEAKAELFDQRLGGADPTTKILELEVAPIIPFWLQLAILALLAALLALWPAPSVSHTDSVQSVRLNGDVSSVVSGSEDCTLRSWQVSTNVLNVNLKPGGEYTHSPIASCQNGKPHQKKGLLAIPNQPVQALRFSPKNNERVAAGLDNSIIQIWDVPRGEKIQELNKDQSKNRDRVFDLIYTSDSLNLFSGHGSGKLRLWTASGPSENFQENPKYTIDLQDKQELTFSIRALALSPDEKTLAIAGQFRRFLLWHWNQSGKQPQLELQTFEKVGGPTGQNNNVFGLAFAPIKDAEILATSDSNGWIAIWNLQQCSKSTQSPSSKGGIVNVDCQLVAHWKGVKELGAIRSLRFSGEDGLTLISGGDDGRVMAWFLTSEYKLDEAKAAEGKLIYQSPRKKKIMSIDAKVKTQRIIIVSGDEDFQVKLHRL